MKKTHPKTEPVVLRHVLRVETTLSRFPIHHLARQGTVRIAIRETGADGELALRWEVSYNSQYGPPGPLAYKLDTLIINRRIEEAGRPTPGLIRLGSLSELCRKLGLPDSGKNIRDIRRALLQNASAFITAKVRHKVRDGTERRIEVGDTRYAIVFTGETLPDGQRADAVYLVPHAFYREILDTATTRPLDFDYLRDLPPAAAPLRAAVVSRLRHPQAQPARGENALLGVLHLRAAHALYDVLVDATADGEGPRPPPAVRVHRQGRV